MRTRSATRSRGEGRGRSAFSASGNPGGGGEDYLNLYHFYAPFLDAGAGVVTTTLERGTGSPTFTRTTTAMTVLSTGLLGSVASGSPRSYYDPTTLEYLGYLAEGARTNLCLHSADLGNAAWVKASFTVAAPTVTANSVVAPDGTTTAAKVEFPEVVGVNAFSIVHQRPAGTAATYDNSIYLRGAVGGEVVYVMATDGVAWTITPCTLTTSWQRFATPSYTNTVPGLYFQVGVDLRDGAQSTQAAQTIYAWGGQIELGAFPSSYIPTTTVAVARNADVLTYVTAGNFSDTAGTMYAETQQVSWSNIAGSIIGSATQGMMPLTTNSGVKGYDGTNTVNGTAGAPSGVVKMAVGWSGSAMNVCGMSSAAVSGSYDGAWNLTTVGIGTSGFGTIGNVKIWPNQLTDAQLQAITA